MRDFILRSCPTMVWVIAAINLTFCILLLKRFLKGKKAMLLCMSLIAFGLFYDALIISLGSVMQGKVLETLSQFRFISHGGLIPLIFPICAYALRFGRKGRIAVWAVTTLIILAGVAEGFATVLEIKQIAGITRYVSSEQTPAWASGIANALSYGTVLPLIVCGILVWIKQKTPALFLSGFLMFAFSALGPATGNFDLIFFISMIGEICMVLFFFLYARRYETACAKTMQ